MKFRKSTTRRKRHIISQMNFFGGKNYNSRRSQTNYLGKATGAIIKFK